MIKIKSFSVSVVFFLNDAKFSRYYTRFFVAFTTPEDGPKISSGWTKDRQDGPSGWTKDRQSLG